MKNRALIVIMGVFCAILIFQTGYLVGLGKNRRMYNLVSGRYHQFRPLIRVQDDWDYSRQIAQMQAKMERMFNEQQRSRPTSLTGVVSRETEKARVITMNLFGMSKDGINVEIKGNYLIIEARQGKTDSVNSFLQILSLPDGIKIPAITAEYNKDILTITMPKDAKINKPTAEIIKIPVK